MPGHRHRESHARAAEELARVAPVVSRWIERVLATHEPPLTVAQLLALEAADSGELVAAGLAERAAVSPAAVSQLLAALERDGLLERGRAEGDRRRQTIALSAEGRRALASARRRLRSALAPHLAGLLPHEADALAAALGRIAADLGAAPPPRRPPRPSHPPRG